MRRSSHQPWISSTRSRYPSVTRSLTNRNVSSEKRALPRRIRSPRRAERYGMIWRSKKSRSAASESASVAATALTGAAGEGEIGAGGLTDFGSIAGGTFSSGFFSGAAIVSAVMVDPTTDFARAVGVLRSAAVEAIGVDPAVITFSALDAG